MTRNDRVTATLEGGFVVFIIGMRVNKPWLVHKWLPVARAMPRMIDELSMHREMGFIHAESWLGRTTVMIQYWRSIEQLLEYSKNKDARHLPAWRDFNRAVGTDGSVGIWHETYLISPGTYESIYVNMPPFGLGKAGVVCEANGILHSAKSRLGAMKTESA